MTGTVYAEMRLKVRRDLPAFVDGWSSADKEGLREHTPEAIEDLKEAISDELMRHPDDAELEVFDLEIGP